MTDLNRIRHSGNNLDLLRLLFASMVLLSHAPQILDHGNGREPLAVLTSGNMELGGLAVNGFFILSGYLIMGSWRARPKVYPYFRNRALRIYPGFVVALTISVLVVRPIATDLTAYFTRFKPLTFLANCLFLNEARWAYSFDGHLENVNGSLWTIKYEFACYVAVAILGTVFAKKLKAACFVLTIGFLSLSTLTPELASWGFGHVALEIVRFGSMFGCGACLFLMDFRRTSDWALFIAGAFFVVSLFSPRFVNLGLGVAGGFLFVGLGYRWAKPHWLLSMPDISYGVYLYGWPVQMLLIWAFAPLGPWIIFLLSLLGSLACGFASWTFVEAKFMKMKATSPRDTRFERLA